MLVHDWSQDLLFFDDPAALAQIASAQREALRELRRTDNVLETMQRFALNSGILKRVVEQLHMTMRTEERP
jgi:hypothetical protein